MSDDEIYIVVPRRSGKQIQQFMQMIDEIRKGKKIRFVRSSGKFEDYARIDDVGRLYKQLFGRSMNDL